MGPQDTNREQSSKAETCGGQASEGRGGNVFLLGAMEEARLDDIIMGGLNQQTV